MPIDNHFTNIVLDVFAIALLFVLLLTDVKRKIHRNLNRNLYHLLIISNMIVTFVDMITWIVDKKMFAGAFTINLLSSSILYGIAPSLGLAWAIYADYKILNDEEGLKKRIIFYLIPFIVNFIISMLSLFFNTYFSINENNVFKRNEPFAYIPFILAFLYAIYGAVITIINRNKLTRSNFSSMLTYMLIPIICTIVQMLSYGLALIYAGFSLSIVIIHINVQNDINVTDYLTGLSNRSHLELFIKNEFRHLKDTESLYGIMLDIDDFKKINDTYGHSEGDHALELFGELLRNGVRPNDFIARYAGDEFIIIVKLKDEADIEKIIERLNSTKNNFNTQSDLPYKIEYSAGYTKYVDGEKYENFLNRIDKNMYIEKKKKK